MPQKASNSAALWDIIRDKAKGKSIPCGSGQARFGDYNRAVQICWKVFI